MGNRTDRNIANVPYGPPQRGRRCDGHQGEMVGGRKGRGGEVFANGGPRNRVKRRADGKD